MGSDFFMWERQGGSFYEKDKSYPLCFFCGKTNASLIKINFLIEACCCDSCLWLVEKAKQKIIDDQNIWQATANAKPESRKPRPTILNLEGIKEIMNKIIKEKEKGY
jgi:hypothetical protein